MIITEKELKKEYGFKDSLPVQDAVIQQFLIVIQDLPRRGGLAQLIIKRAAPVLMLILFFACLVSGLYKGFHQTLLMFLAILVFTCASQTFPGIRQIWGSSGIKYDFRRHSGHFLLCTGVCTLKNMEAKKLSPSIYSARVRLSSGKYLDAVPFAKKHWDEIPAGGRVFVVAANEGNSFCFFGLPQPVLQISSSKNQEDSPIRAHALRPIGAEDLPKILAAEKERIRIRRHLYLKNQLLFIGASAAFLIFQIFRLNSGGIMLGAFMLLACCAVHISNYAQDKSFRKSLRGKKELFCADATAHSCLDGTRDAVAFKDTENHVLFTSRLRDDIHWFRDGDRALLVYYNPQKPTAYKITI